jgi:hypothetical protein
VIDGIDPIPTVPGENPEADAFNILLAGLAGDLKDIQGIVRQQERFEVEQTLACMLAWLCGLIGHVPTVGEAFVLHCRRVAQTPGSPLKNRAERNADG